MDRIGAEPGVVTISATGLVHEAYLKLVGSGDWADRVHFVAVAARAMRQILTDRARARRAEATDAAREAGPQRGRPRTGRATSLDGGKCPTSA